MKIVKITDDVIFRKFKNNEIIALFPHEAYNSKGNVNSYMHIGQHGEANYDHIINVTKLATKQEYSDLEIELKSIGYNLNIVKRRNYKKFLKNLKNLKIQ